MPESINAFSARSELFIEELDHRKIAPDDDEGNEKNDGNDAAKSPQAYL